VSPNLPSANLISLVPLFKSLIDFRTDVGEVLQFDFDGDEGKEMLMRRFIQDQKQPHANEPAYARGDREHLQILQNSHVGDTQHRHHQGDEPARPDKEKRPKAAAASSRRHLLPAKDIPELVEEDEAPHHHNHLHHHRHNDDEAHHRKEKGKHHHHPHKELRESKSHSKSKDRSRSRETDEGGEGKQSKSRSRSRETSKSPLPEVRVEDDGHHLQVRDRSHSQSRSKRSGEKLDSSGPARRSSSPVLISREIKMEEERTEGRHLRVGSGELTVGMGNLLIPDDLDGILKEEDEEDDSGIGIVGVAQRSKMLEKKSVFTIAYDEMATQNVLRPDTAANYGS